MVTTDDRDRIDHYLGQCRFDGVADGGQSLHQATDDERPGDPVEPVGVQVGGSKFRGIDARQHQHREGKR